MILKFKQNIFILPFILTNLLIQFFQIQILISSFYKYA